MSYQITTNGRFKEEGGGTFTVEPNPDITDDFFLDMSKRQFPSGERVDIVKLSKLKPLAFRRNPLGENAITMVRRKA